MNNSSKKYTFVFCTPIVDVGQSNGILSILSLAKGLERLGCDVYFFNILSEHPDDEIILTKELEKRSTKVEWKELLDNAFSSAATLGIKLLIDKSDDRLVDAFVVYPERIKHNPLGATNIIRYFGNKDGVLSAGKLVDVQPRDFILAHSRILHPNPHFVLFFAHVNPLFNDLDARPFEDRSKNITYVGKGILFSNVGPITGSELVTKDYPATKEALAELLKDTQFAFTWDSWSNIVVEAIFCGAIPVILNFAPFSERELDESELGPIPRLAIDRLSLDNETKEIKLFDIQDLHEFRKSRLAFIDRVHKYNLDYAKRVGLLLDSVVQHFSNPPAPADRLASLSLLHATDEAFVLAKQGVLSIIDLFNVAQRLTDATKPVITVDLYRLWLASTDSPLAYAAQFNLGVLLAALENNTGAEAAYRSAILQKPDFMEGKVGLAILLEDTGRSAEALTLWRNVLTLVNLKPPAHKTFYLQALNHVGQLLENRNELAEAELMLSRSLKEDSKQEEVLARWVDLRQKLCIWPVFGEANGVTVEDMVAAASVLTLLGETDDPKRQLDDAHRYVEDRVLKDVHAMSSRQSYGHERLRIGYLCPDFSAPLLSNLTAEFYGLHDRSRFEVFGFSWGARGDATLHARLTESMDQHFDVGPVSDDQAACLIRSHEIDILVDLNGLFPGARPDIMSYRPAPVQIVWPGFPGTTALPEVDYVLSDSFALPKELEAFFSETPLRMPQIFQINGRQRDLGPIPTRKSCGLPDKAFVFCCFNSNRKFNPEMFAVWMRILKRVPGSILWLAADNDSVRDNLYKVAKKLGIARARLHFAKRVDSPDTLALFQLASLFLDTFPYGAGATASDALWSGLPVLTCAGRSFASRRAGSLLNALGLPELITYNLQDYEDQAVALSENRTKLDALKRQLEESRLSCALFDNQRFVSDLEALYRKVIVELPAAPTKPNHQDVDLTYIEPPNAEPNLNVQQNVTDRRYVIVTPPFQHNSAGIRVLFDLQKWLVRAGLDAIICTWFEGYPVEQFADDIVIYPEVAPGNVLKAKRVIRYIMNVPGKLGYGEKTYDPSEILLAYNKELAPYANGRVLQVPSIEPFFNSNNCAKTVDAMFVGKGQDLGLHPPACIEITKTYPATRREMAALLRSARTLYTYDDFTMLSYEAWLCGCEVKLIRKDGSIVDYPLGTFPTLDEFKVQLHEFIEMTRRL